MKKVAKCAAEFLFGLLAFGHELGFGNWISGSPRSDFSIKLVRGRQKTLQIIGTAKK
jgi:hypothetical protein